MEKILKFKQEVLDLKIYSQIDYYPGSPYYIGKDRDEEFGRTEPVFHYYVGLTSNVALNKIRDKALFSIARYSVDDLKAAYKLLEPHNYDAFFEELDLLSSKFKFGKTAKVDELRFKAVFKNQFKESLPKIGKITPLFVGSLKREIKKRVAYLDELKKGVIRLIAAKDEDEANALSNLSTFKYPPHQDYYCLYTRMSRNNTKEINFYDILDNALRYIDDSIGMQEYFKSEHARAKDKYYYTNDRFYKDLLRVVIKEREMVWLALKIFEVNKKRGVSLPDLQVPELAHDLASIELFIQNINEVRFEESVQETKSLIALNNNTTLPKRVKLLFKLIEFLYSNTANFNRYNNVILDETLLLYKVYGVGPLNSFEERIYMPIIKQSLQSKNEVIYINIAEPIRSRAHSLGVCNWSETRSLWEWNIEDIEKLHENYSAQDLIIIKEYEQMYAVYRDKTNHCAYGCNDFFYDLDETLNHLFSVFRDKKKEEKLIKSAQLEEVVNQQNIENTMDINYEAIFTIALGYKDDPEEMKAYFIREQKKANRDFFYEKESFYNGLLKIVADKKELAKYQSGPTPTHMGSFFIAGGGGLAYDNDCVELLEQVINELRDEGSVQRIEQTNKDKHENNATPSSKIKPLFNFIDFLHANIENFNQNMKIVLEWKKARWQERQFRQTYSDKLKMREVQKVITAKWNQLSEQLIEPISEKAIEIDVCVLDNPKSIYTNFSHHMVMLQENFHEEDVDEIMKVKKQYIEIRNNINLHIILLLKEFFKYFDELMKHLVKFFYEDGDKTIPKIVDIYLDDYFNTPESFELPLSDSQVKDFYDSLLIEHQEVICEDTDFYYFSYAISGNEIPLKKTPYKPVKLRGTIDSMYYELLELMKSCGVIPHERKTIPPVYVQRAEELFINRNGNPLKLRTPK